MALPSLKSENIVGGYNLPVITPEQFYVEDWRASGHDYRMGDAVRALGLWYGANAHPQLIVRSGTIATATLGPVQFETGAIQAYLMDVTVTRAMSGGPVYGTRGRGWAESALLGVTYGYWPVDTELLEPLSEPNEAAEDRFRRAMLQEVERLNSRLAIVTPVHHLAELLIRHPLWNAPTIN